jgi:hypothetical protein
MAALALALLAFYLALAVGVSALLQRLSTDPWGRLCALCIIPSLCRLCAAHR